MSSYFFHANDPDSAEFIAPPPPEYAEMTHRRALWQNFGLRPEDMTVEDYFNTLEMLAAESKKRN